MKRLPESELELMLIIWRFNAPITRPAIEASLDERRHIGATTVLSFLSRLVEKGFVKVTKQGKNNVYEALVREKDYLQTESASILKKLYRSSVRQFVASLYEGDHISERDIDDLQAYLDEKRKNL